MNEDAEFWDEATRRGVPWFRFLRRPITVDSIDQVLLGTRLEEEWTRLKAQMESGDELWRFTFTVRRYLGTREGYLLLRRGKPVGGIVTTVS